MRARRRGGAGRQPASARRVPRGQHRASAGPAAFPCLSSLPRRGRQRGRPMRARRGRRGPPAAPLLPVAAAAACACACALLACAAAARASPSPSPREALPEVQPGARGVPLRLGERVALPELGPVIVNKDCSLRRIENWGDMTEAERGATSRRVAKVCGCARNTHTAPHPPTQYDTRGISGLCHASDSARWR